MWEDWYAVFEESSIESIRRKLHSIEKMADAGSAPAAYFLSFAYDPDSVFTDEIKIQLGATKTKSESFARLAYERYSHEVETGNEKKVKGEAAYCLANFYQGEYSFIDPDPRKFVELNEAAVKLGYLFAANNLVTVYGEKDSAFYDPERAKEMYELLELNNVNFVQNPDTRLED